MSENKLTAADFTLLTQSATLLPQRPTAATSKVQKLSEQEQLIVAVHFKKYFIYYFYIQYSNDAAEIKL